ncbi:RBP protein [Aspergillus karnatakaensis]|uniref:RBP protein n=1 Tax=Aspergillus karnatakaensis TaxID=1810916 RepID=UPI003CCD95CF
MDPVQVLPAHDLPMDVPSPSEVITSEDGDKAYRWLLTETERAHIAEMLGVPASEITRTGNLMMEDREVCSCCGKHSGLDDLVHNAFYIGIHNKDFMLDILNNGPTGPSPGHSLYCSRCTSKFQMVAIWASKPFPW